MKQMPYTPNPFYRKLFEELINAPREEINRRLAAEPAHFNHLLYNEFRHACQSLNGDAEAMARLNEVLQPLMATISRNTIELFLTVPDKEVRKQVAYNGWYLLNNKDAMIRWQELVNTSLNPEDLFNLKQFIGLAKSRLHELFLAEENPEMLLVYLKNHLAHLDDPAMISHAVRFVEGDARWQQAMVDWGRWLTKHINSDPALYPEMAIIGLEAVIIALAGQELDPLLSDAHEYLGTTLAQQRTKHTEANIDSAIRHYETALQFYQKETYASRYSSLQMKLGIAYDQKLAPDRSANVEAAIGYFTEAAASGMTGNSILINQGNAHLARFVGMQQDNIRQAITYYEQAAAVCGDDDEFELGMAYNNAGVAYKLIKPFTKSEAVNAINAFKAALSIRTELKYPYEWAETLHNLGGVYSMLPDNRYFEFEDAMESFEDALRIRTELKYPYDWAGTLNDLATALMLRYKHTKEPSLLPRIRQTVDNALSVRTPDALPYDSLKTSSYYGIFLYDIQEDDAVVHYLEMSFKAYDHINENAVNYLTRSRMLEAYDHIFDLLIASYLNTDRVDDAFGICARAKGRLLAEKISAHSETEAPADEYRTSAGWQVISVLTKNINETQDALVNALGATGLHARVLALYSELRALYARRKLEVEKFSYQYPMEALARSFLQVGHERAREMARELDAVIIEYYYLFDQWVAFVVSGENIRAFALPGSDKLVAYIRNWTDQLNQHGPAHSDEKEETTMLTALYDRFFRTFQHALPLGDRLILSPQKDLHQIPLQAAINKDNGLMLFEQYDISFISGVNMLGALQGRKPAGTSSIHPKAVLVAHPGHMERSLKYVHEEVKAIADFFSDPVTLDEQSLKKNELLGTINRAAPQVLHFACHSSFNAAYPSLSGLLLDELLTVEDITAYIKLGNEAFVCLSACRSSISESGPGDELTGLTQAFLQAGARQVIGSLWLVNDHSTSLFFTEFYKQWAGGTASLHDALRAATSKIRSAGYHSMYYWAAFQLTGPGR